ncbi:MAG TPA: homoserine kinase [Syntrophomonadaceae bacterium]|nr:homoserine kinase [Syntrophomonadaceae bacterium]HPR94639.1 homoserine kinase [Syntrophomonadaceae bacterium]
MITVKVPATSANLGPGFDTLGMALDLFLTVEAENAPVTSCQFFGEGHERLNTADNTNLILSGLNKVFQEARKSLPALKLTINNQIPVGKGLGSSAAAVIAGLFLGNQLLDTKFDIGQLIKFAVELEGHADNAVPAIVGGLTVVMEYEGEIYYQKINMPEKLKIIAAVPDFELPTHKSRQVLPATVNLHDSVANMQKACFLLASIFNNDFSHMFIAMDDKIYQPYRKQFIPGFDEVLKNAKKAGAIGAFLSGAGPSVIAFAEDREEMIGRSMKEIFADHDVACRILYLKPDQAGTLII